MASELFEDIKRARAEKRLSQRDLGRLLGMPQSHISKIESGAVDIKLSSLIQICRVLDLELKLVPRKSVPAVEAIIKASSSRLTEQEAPRPAYSLEGDDE
ncbi:helix-turn-helix transcriptional regulator [Cohaesibacter sp. CAU 1516]|nr:helix-turn-helix transcriptional regulator [Cohaesibacter sp. CAU 1516]